MGALDKRNRGMVWNAIVGVCLGVGGGLLWHAYGSYVYEPPAVWDHANPVAEFVTSMGTFKAEIYMDRVPRLASNFIDLVHTGFYDDLHFHRIIDDFVVQFGCPHAKKPGTKHFRNNAGSGGPPDGEFKNLARNSTEKRFGGGNVYDEHVSRDTNAKWTLAAANTGAAHSGGSQFFVNLDDNTELDWHTQGPAKHPVFGKVVEGFDVVAAISKIEVNHNDVPVDPIKMHSARVIGLPDIAAQLLGTASFKF